MECADLGYSLIYYYPLIIPATGDAVAGALPSSRPVCNIGGL